MEQYNLRNKITIIIVLYRENYNLLYKTLDKIREFRKIIIDNSNNIELKSKVEANFEIEKYILNKKNIGFSSGYNQGVKLCETDFSLIIGPDCIIDIKSIIKLYERLTLNENCFLTTPTSYNENNQLTYAAGLLPENGEKDFPIKLEGDICVENTLGACMFFKKKDFIEIGLFDEIFFIFFSDDDLCRKIKKRGKYIIQVFESKCIHSHGISKIKNVFEKIYLREHYFLLDKFHYFRKSNRHKNMMNSIIHKKNKYLIKIFFSLIAMKFKKVVYYFARYTAILKFNNFLKKN
jgi:GT2 family glycosyltransferase